MTRHGEMITTAGHACRVPIFAPVRRVGRGLVRQRVESAWGHATITGHLGQRERDALDSVCEAAQAWRPESTGDVTALVDSARLRASLGWDRWKYSQIRDALRALRAAEIELIIHGERSEWSGIITHIVEAGDPPPERVGSRSRWRTAPPVPEPGRTSPRDGMMWEITISRAWIALMRRLQVRYPAAVFHMRYGVSQAAARFILSHKPGATMRIDTVLDAVGVQSRDRARARRELAADASLMATAGVHIDWAAGVMTTHPAPETTRPAPETTRPAPENTRPAPEPIDL
ncbi:hypothetical protein [Acidihalobacter prosperus]|uniref:hypothetical protein n=1 Tax=Acidihalobacter prosperus TaxID=160660 RepID=UPI00191C0FCE|nr:hypothetical protein [Acidihalobacter prosperus]